MKIGFLCLDWSPMKDEKGYPTPGGAGWYRLAMPQQYLARNGIDAHIGNDVKQAKDGTLILVDFEGNRYECDVLVMARWMDSWAASATLVARAGGQVIINDVDDFYDGIHPSNLAWRTSHPKYNPNSNRNHYRKNLAASSAITVSTPFLAEKLAHLDCPVHLVRNAIDLERWTPRNVAGSTSVGWVGVTGFRSNDLEQLGGILPEWLAHNRASFHHSGASPDLPAVRDLIGIHPSCMYSEAGMRDIYHYPQLFQGFNVGLVPLNNIPFNQAKSSIKGMEYAASGIPFIASGTSEYEWLLEQGIGVPAPYMKKWKWQRKVWHDALDQLHDPMTRKTLADTFRHRVEQFDMAKKWLERVDVYTTIASDSAYTAIKVGA